MVEAAQENTQGVFNMEKIYLKDLSLEIPHSPQIFLERDNPQIDVQLNTLASSFEERVFEVVVMATVTAKLGGKVADIGVLANLAEIAVENSHDRDSF